MRRREFIAGFTAAAVCPLVVRAQQTRTLRLGIVAVNARDTVGSWVAFERRLRQLGYVDGQNLKVEFIQVNLQDDTIRAAVTRLVSSDVDIIVTGGNEFAAKAALAATKVIPIVIIAFDYDPLALAIVASLARPGGTSLACSLNRSNLHQSGCN